MLAGVMSFSTDNFVQKYRLCLENVEVFVFVCFVLFWFFFRIFFPFHNSSMQPLMTVSRIYHIQMTKLERSLHCIALHWIANERTSFCIVKVLMVNLYLVLKIRTFRIPIRLNADKFVCHFPFMYMCFCFTPSSAQRHKYFDGKFMKCRTYFDKW